MCSEELDELEETIAELQNSVDELEDEVYDLRCKLVRVDDCGIKNTNNFIKWLHLENLYTPQLEEFIKYYLRNHNE